MIFGEIIETCLRLSSNTHLIYSSVMVGLVACFSLLRVNSEKVMPPCYDSHSKFIKKAGYSVKI